MFSPTVFAAVCTDTSKISAYPVHICSRNNFPTAAGLASSASGFAALVADRLGGSAHPVLVPGPAGDEVPAAITLVDDASGGTAYLDSAQVCGRHLVAADRLHAL